MHGLISVTSVLSCKHVDEVIIGAPWAVTEDMVRTMNISVVVRGTVSDDSRALEGENDAYKVPRDMGILKEFPSPSVLTVHDIIGRILSQREMWQTRYEQPVRPTRCAKRNAFSDSTRKLRRKLTTTPTRSMYRKFKSTLFYWATLMAVESSRNPRSHSRRASMCRAERVAEHSFNAGWLVGVCVNLFVWLLVEFFESDNRFQNMLQNLLSTDLSLNLVRDAQNVATLPHVVLQVCLRA